MPRQPFWKGSTAEHLGPKLSGFHPCSKQCHYLHLQYCFFTRQASVGAAAVLSQKYLHRQNNQQCLAVDDLNREQHRFQWGTARSKGNVRMTGWQALHRDRRVALMPQQRHMPLFLTLHIAQCYKIGLSLNIATSATWTKALKCLNLKQCTKSKRSFQPAVLPHCTEAATIPAFVFAKQ